MLTGVADGEDARGLRQWPTLVSLVRRVAQMPQFACGLLIGSFARGTANAMSDIDVILVPPDDKFEQAWHGRQDLHGTDVLAAWDERGEGTPGAHKWLTADLVFVECLIVTPSSGTRLAPPSVVVVGGANLADKLEARPPISRDEMHEASQPLERAYDALKQALREMKRDRTADDGG